MSHRSESHRLWGDLRSGAHHDCGLQPSVLNDNSFAQSARMGSAAEKSRTLVVWCSPDIPWQADGIQREGPQTRARTHELIETQVVPAIASLPVVVSLGTLADRVAQLLPRLT